jgi:hypothetical protein
MTQFRILQGFKYRVQDLKSNPHCFRIIILLEYCIILNLLKSQGYNI